MGLIQRVQDRRLLKVLEQAPPGYPIDEMAAALGISQRITAAQRRKDERDARKKR